MKFEEEFDGLQLYLYVTSSLEEIRLSLDLRLCDIAAIAYANGDYTKYQMSAIQLNARHNELKCIQNGNHEKIEKYIDGMIAEGSEEYRHVKLAFSERCFDELSHLK